MNFPNWLAPLVCLALTIVVGFWLAIGVVFQLNYTSSATLTFTAVLLGATCVLVVALYLAFVRWKLGSLSGKTRGVSVGLGLMSAMIGAYGMIVDSSDIQISVWPFLFGCSLLWLAK